MKKVVLHEALQKAMLSSDEIYVLRSFALLGKTVVDREKFCFWIGGDYWDAVNSLVEKNWIQLKENDAKVRLTMDAGIGEAVRNELKPDFHNCIWAKKLCDDIVDEVTNLTKPFQDNRFNNPDYNLSSEKLITKKCLLLERLVLEILKNLDYSKSEDVNLAINYLRIMNSDGSQNMTHSFQEGVSTMEVTGIMVESLALSPYFKNSTPRDTSELIAILECLVLSTGFTETANEQKFEAHHLLAVALLDMFVWLNIQTLYGNKCDLAQEIDEMTEKTVNCLKKAETFLDEYPEIVNNKTADIHRLYQRIVASTQASAIKEKLSVVSERFPDFLSVHGTAIAVRRDTTLESFFRSVSESSAERDFSESVTQEISMQYKKRLEKCIGSEELNNTIAELFTDRRFSRKIKIIFVIKEIESLGFDPFAMYSICDDNSVSEALVKSCSAVKNQRKAKAYIDFLEPMLRLKSSYFEYYSKDHVTAQGLIIACCMCNTAAVAKYLKKYLFYLKQNEPCMEDNIVNIVRVLYVLNHHETATTLFQKGIALMESEAKNTNIREEVRFQIYESLIRMIKCPDRTEHYKERQLEIINAGFMIE